MDRLCLGLAALLLAAITDTAAAAKRKAPKLPPDLDGECPFHRTDAAPAELSEFSHELERDGRQPEALRCYALAIRSSPRDATGWFDLATALQYSDRKRALSYYRHALTLRPSAFHYNQYGILLRAADRHDEAAATFRAAIAIEPTNADAPFHLGGTHETLDQHGEALSVYRRALEVETANEARIHNNIGNVLGKLGDWGAAIAAYREAEEADPAFPETHSNLAHVFTSLGRFEEAEAQLKRARRLLPADAALAEREARLAEAVAKRADEERKAKWRREMDKRDGHLTREERVERFQQVIGLCGPGNKECMRQALGQEDVDEDIPIRF